MRLGDANFLNLFARIAAHANPGRDEWRIEGVHWTRRRLVNWDASLSFQIEIHRLHYSARGPWTLLYVHEMWWSEDREKTIRNTHWVRLQSGSRKDVLKWFKDRESEMEASEAFVCNPSPASA